MSRREQKTSWKEDVVTVLLGLDLNAVDCELLFCLLPVLVLTAREILVGGASLVAL